MKKVLNVKSIIKTLELHKKEISNLGVEKIGLFGSYLKGNTNENSDIDFVVSFKKIGFDNYMDLKFMLEKVFSRNVDIITINTIKPSMRYVKDEAIYLRI